MKIYLAIPYSASPQRSFEIACEVAAHLMMQGHVVFSPISHGHVLSDYLAPELRTDSEWWMQHDLPFVEWCDEVWVVRAGPFGMDLIAESVGVQMEVRHAGTLGKPVHVIDYDSLTEKK
jgi:hypothetical protein